MEKAEIILGVISITALLLNLIIIPESSFLIVLSLSALSVFYMVLSVILFNDIRIIEILKNESFKRVSSMRLVGSILLGFTLSMTIFGLLFKVQFWPEPNVKLGTGLFGLLIALIVGYIKYSKTKSAYYTKIFKRIAVYGGFGLILMLMPRETLLEIKHRNHPEYVEAVKKAMNEPDNQELWEKVEDKRQKINEEN